MQPTPALTRARTLQELLGNHQNGSTRVRSSGRVAEELIPDQQQNGDEEHSGDDYFNQLSSPELVENDVSEDDDYDLDPDSDVNERPVTTPAAERVFGGADNFQTYGREQREPMTNITDTLPEAVSRSFEAMPVLEMATPIESTRQDLPQLFGLDGQTGPLQAQSEVERGVSTRTTRRVMSKIQLEILVMKREALRKEAELAKQMSFVMSALSSVTLLKQSKPRVYQGHDGDASDDGRQSSHQDHEEGYCCSSRELALQP